jgi:protein farnesyltransferase/geranylgeranyltransferase type-1 subunit alpha
MKYHKDPTKEGYQNLIKLLEELKNRDFRRVNYWNHKDINLKDFNKQNGKSFD